MPRPPPRRPGRYLHVVAPGRAVGDVHGHPVLLGHHRHQLLDVVHDLAVGAAGHVKKAVHAGLERTGNRSAKSLYFSSDVVTYLDGKAPLQLHAGGALLYPGIFAQDLVDLAKQIGKNVRNQEKIVVPFTQEITSYLAQYVAVSIVLQSRSHRREQLGFRALQGHFERIHQVQRVSKTNDVVEPFLVREGCLFSRNYHAEGQELLDVAETTDLEEKSGTN